ncbi:MAG TPA: c-type cytochrome [Anaerolineae bacterium]|nr:c-type cytochrome [Anaerolineae bacterium]
MKSQAIHFGLAVVIVCLLSACAGDVSGIVQPRTYSDANVASGRRLIASYGCGSCHSIPGIPGADALAAPPLNHFGERSYIAGLLPNNWEKLIKWIQNPQQIKPGTAMPNLGVKEDEAKDIAAYLYHQPTIGELFSR